MKELKKIIEETYENKNKINLNNLDYEILQTIFRVIKLLNNGIIRISEKKDNTWITHEWLKKAVLLYIYIKENKFIEGSYTSYYDKVPLKYEKYNEKQFKKEKVRIVPPATIRYGAFINYNTIIMPSYINIGAYIDQGTMIDTWATIGSCAQIGKNVHISGGVGIGGVLEPLQNNPTIIEDNCFIGARSEIVEGVVIEKGCVISMGVFIGQSTKIYDRENGKIFYGRVPAHSVVVSGTLPSENRNYNLYAAIIVKKVDAKTLGKTEINQLLRNIK
ncbi:2,3,4,5-tetrahydropyridine-2,6-dicarboxylate N-succinyltransferase [Buchnera aphidicola str. APS (Acyrthosiphon pisum)]|uniref:2,3,4,5-tetrahydropyridine-2,6-dicarboxylate N-succinyltransferase n=2 Tax=Buchnera aphidicola TaxID=9 RepID=DAPD_BUCAI|nr:2,3,4,5-tetrahydropyridine-2,6-dicarboxylate N-succinyltransferase [Buchnera aphidicola]P57323.1 RecName: Full=2,3,4,5-tetrahydropyridine-2,6-dicarboxylate N-succinyltransferase; AltName: Full=Tetrahydrodipicolinate N-succinyltransferase; Short=THDP succinyltransferase; Short=THP succinyltransferase; Short=Tetrahydropicolinate succinylase [Buchnera aphidicola str. APS (Acyrthosiphon pisum)]pir/H84956/ 2,3,4,5-tetrahydropyridine-2,6-dicarboxylate N-succinyltransferase (EC 2.3.1.117) [imported] 